MISSPCLLTVLVVVAVSCDCSLVCFSISAICCRWAEGAEISMPRMMSRISDWVREATLTLQNNIKRLGWEGVQLESKANPLYTLAQSSRQQVHSKDEEKEKRYICIIQHLRYFPHRCKPCRVIHTLYPVSCTSRVLQIVNLFCQSAITFHKSHRSFCMSICSPDQGLTCFSCHSQPGSDPSAAPLS